MNSETDEEPAPASLTHHAKQIQPLSEISGSVPVYQISSKSGNILSNVIGDLTILDRFS